MHFSGAKSMCPVWFEGLLEQLFEVACGSPPITLSTLNIQPEKKQAITFCSAAGRNCCSSNQAKLSGKVYRSTERHENAGHSWEGLMLQILFPKVFLSLETQELFYNRCYCITGLGWLWLWVLLCIDSPFCPSSGMSWRQMGGK